MSDNTEFVITNGRPEIGCQKSGVQEYLLMASSATNVAPYYSAFNAPCVGNKDDVVQS